MKSRYKISSLVLIISAFSYHYYISKFKSVSQTMPLNPANFPRPPLVERVTKHLQVKWPTGEIIADTRSAYWVLETHHPPTYYIPPSDIKMALTKTSRSSYCEWKGMASYFTITPPGGAVKKVENRIWTYEDPTPRFKEIKDYLSFYNGPWECFVDGEKAEPQPGDFYGGWVTSEIVGKVKGGPGTLGW